MPEFIERPSIITLQAMLPANAAAEAAFVGWQGRFQPEIAVQPGFISLEFLSPNKEQKGWLVVQRFVNFSAADSWKESERYKFLVNDLKTITIQNSVQEATTDEKSILGGVTEVIFTEVEPNQVAAFCEWNARLHQQEAVFPGFRGVYTQSPQTNGGRNWITLLQFDTMEHLDHWLNSPERKKLLSESAPLIKSLETHRVVSPYAGWFASIAKTGEIPAVWQQTMVILLVLFPIVMLEFKYLSPFTNGLNISLATFIGNAISVSLISFPMMPIAVRLLGWWLSPGSRYSRLRIVGGTFLVSLLYLAEIALFWKFL